MNDIYEIKTDGQRVPYTGDINITPLGMAEVINDWAAEFYLMVAVPAAGVMKRTVLMPAKFLKDPYALIATVVALTTALSGKADTSAVNDALTKRPRVYNGSALLSDARVLASSGVTNGSGVATIPLVDANGDSLFPIAVLNVQPFVNDNASAYQFSHTIAGDRKSMTITVKKASVTLLAVISVNVLAAPVSAPSGVTVTALVVGY